jgi:two-component system nitrate/nitrite response regulator NarL
MDTPPIDLASRRKRAVPTATDAGQNGHTPARTRILIVAQPRLFRSALCQALSDRLSIGLISDAGSGIEALRLATEDRPSLVILDPLVPGGGISLAQALHLNDARCALVVLSRPRDRESVVTFLQAGVTAFIDPDARLDEAVETLERVSRGEFVIGARIASLMRGAERSGSKRNGLDELSGREREIVIEVAAGKSNGEIARDLGISGNTVKGHLVNIFRKLDLSNRVQVTTFAIENGLTEKPLRFSA